MDRLGKSSDREGNETGGLAPGSEYGQLKAKIVDDEYRKDQSPSWKL